jgi:hypothetical protein
VGSHSESEKAIVRPFLLSVIQNIVSSVDCRLRFWCFIKRANECSRVE